MAEVDIDSKLNYEAEYSKYLKNVKKKGNSIQANCPFHKGGNEKKPSFSVDLKTGRYKCFACEEEGNYIKFISQMKNIGTKEAAKEIYKEIGIDNIVPIEDYTIDIYAHEKKLPVDWLKEEWGLKNLKHYIGIPYFNKERKLIGTRKRGTNKDFKWNQNSKLWLYGIQNIEKIRQQEYVVLVEGESDTHTLSYYNIPVLGVPGASTFNSAWVEDIKDIKKIYIHHENDTGGDTFVKSVCKGLLTAEYKGEVYKIECCSVGVKDPSELHIKRQKDFTAIWNNIIESKTKLEIEQIVNKPEVVIPGAPIQPKIPVGWLVNETGVFAHNDKMGGNVLICSTPMLINSRIKSLESNEEKIEITYYIDKKWHFAIYPRSTIFQSRNLPILTDIGIAITSENAKKMVTYLDSLFADNKDILPVKRTVTQLGWHGNKFLPCVPGDIILDVDRNGQKWIDAYDESGTLEEWIEHIKPYRYNNIFRGMMAASFGATLLKDLSHRTVFFHLWGDSRVGKTALLKAALSVWGNPETLMVSFNATKVGLERRATLFNDLPVGIDEKQVAGDNQAFIENLVYMLGTGSGKLRGSKTGGTQAISNWRSFILTTGEEPISTMTSQSGIITRALEITGTPFYSTEEAAKMHEISESYYGTAGKKFVEELILRYPKRNELKERYKDIVARLKDDTQDKISTHITAIAVIILADILQSELLFNETDTEERSYQMGLELLDNLTTVKESDIVEKAYDYIHSWVISNKNSFDLVDVIGISVNSYGYERYGIIDKGKYYILPHILQGVLEKQKMSYRKILKGLADRDYIDKDNQGRNLVTKRWDGQTQRFIAFKTDMRECPFD